METLILWPCILCCLALFLISRLFFLSKGFGGRYGLSSGESWHPLTLIENRTSSSLRLLTCDVSPSPPHSFCSVSWIASSTQQFSFSYFFSRIIQITRTEASPSQSNFPLLLTIPCLPTSRRKKTPQPKHAPSSVPNSKADVIRLPTSKGLS